MFIKLLKHEFKATRRIVPLVYLVTVFLILSNLLVRQLDIKWLSGLLLGLLVLVGLAEIVLTYVVVFFRYYKNLYNSEGYLMHTLPVAPRQLLASKIAVSFVWLLASYLLMLGVVLTIIALVAGDQGQSLHQVLDQIIQGTTLQPASFWWLAAAFIAYICLSIFYLMAQVFFSITVGNLSRFHKLGLAAPILFYMGTYFAMQIVVMIGLVVVPLGLTVENHALVLVPRSTLVTLLNPDEFVFGLGSVLFIVLATVGLFVATARMLKKNTSLK